VGKSQLTLSVLKKEATQFADILTENTDPLLFGVTDGKALGSYFEQRFRSYLRERYHFVEGNSATGIDFPDLNVDIKLTSIKQPQSSCPYRSAREKVYGLDYSLLIFVYEKVDVDKVGRQNIISVIFFNKERTGDYQTTSGLLEILKNRGNKDDILTFLRNDVYHSTTQRPHSLQRKYFKTLLSSATSPSRTHSSGDYSSVVS